MAKKIFNFLVRAIPALIMLQTLFFKFSGADESIYIFTTVGMEPWGRYGSGILELIASVLLLLPRTSWVGAGLGLGLMLGAIGMHLTLLGIEVQGDGGYLFLLALIVAVSCTIVLFQNKTKLEGLLKGKFSL